MDNHIKTDLAVSHRFLEIANQNTKITPLLNAFILKIQKMTGCEAVGIQIGRAHV